jgi:hypothetical protein
VSENDDVLLQRALEGDLPDEDLSELLARRPGLRARYGELATVVRSLDAARGAANPPAPEHDTLEDAGIVDLARAETTDADRRRVAAALARARGVPSVADAVGPRRRWLAAASIAAAIAFVAWLGTRAPEQPSWLDARREIVPSSPIGDRADFATFRWSGSLGPAETFVVRIHGEEADGSRGRLLLVSPRRETQEWSPDEAELAELPAAIAWHVERLDASGVPSRSSDEARARRSR